MPGRPSMKNCSLSDVICVLKLIDPCIFCTLHSSKRSAHQGLLYKTESDVFTSVWMALHTEPKRLNASEDRSYRGQDVLSILTGNLVKKEKLSLNYTKMILWMLLKLSVLGKKLKYASFFTRIIWWLLWLFGGKNFLTRYGCTGLFSYIVRSYVYEK